MLECSGVEHQFAQPNAVVARKEVDGSVGSFLKSFKGYIGPIRFIFSSCGNMKYSLTLLMALVASWLFWSGHLEPFMLALGALSCLFCLWICHRMQIVDSEGAPAQLGLRPQTTYAPWLIKEIIKSNIDVTRIVLSPNMKLKRNLIEIGANQRSDLGRVILANSITLTPGTVSVRMDGDRILVHALSFEGAEEDLSGEMDRRVCRLEGKGE